MTENAEIALRRLHGAVVSSSLEAMERFKSGQQRLSFWIDSVCANQRDLKERGHQVSIMWRVYSLANFVLIWLGPEDGRTRSAIEAIQSLFEEMRRETNNFKDAETTLWSLQEDFKYRRSSIGDLGYVD